MFMKYAVIAIGLVVAAPTVGFAQGTLNGARDGANAGAATAGPIGGIVGGAVGAATGTVGGVLGVPADRGCESRSVHRENSAGETETVSRTNCP